MCVIEIWLLIFNIYFVFFIVFEVFKVFNVNWVFYDIDLYIDKN